MLEKTEDYSLTELEKEIWNHEQRLQELRNDYMARTGHMPTRKLNDSSWKWSIFMCLGFAFISMVVYLLGINKVGSDAGMGIPGFFFNTEIAYFAILTFYVVLTVLIIQSKQLSGYQSMTLMLGFWCAHWLIYDWGWYAYEYGVGEIDLSVFWQNLLGTPIFIPDLPFWLFLIIAVLGGLMAFYTFTIPRCRKQLIPPIIWLYTGYFNASICRLMGLSADNILIVGIVLVVIAFGLMGFFIFQRLKRGLPEWLVNYTKRKWTIDPLGLPFVFVIVGMLLLMHLFLTINPTLGLFLGMIPWYFLPTYYIVVHSTGVAKVRRKWKFVIIGILTALFVAFVVLVSILPITSLI